MDLKPWIRNDSDFPKKGILFRDISPLLKNPSAMRFVIDSMCQIIENSGADSIGAIEARGFIFAAPVSATLGIPFIPIRKPGKLAPPIESVKYDLEYGSGKLEVNKNCFDRGQKVAIVDDLLATGGTAEGAMNLITRKGAEVVLGAFVIELVDLQGRDRLSELNIFSMIKF